MSRLRQRNTHSQGFRGNIQQKDETKLKKGREGASSTPSLKYEISSLLSLFNEMEIDGQVDRRRMIRMMQTIGLEHQVHLLTQDYYTFDEWLSILGQLQSPTQPSVYILSFLSLLANYRQKCLHAGDQALPEANAVHQRILKIRQVEMMRQKQRIRRQHKYIYEEMERSQEQQFRKFQQEWEGYLNQFRSQTEKKLSERRRERRQRWEQQQSRWLSPSGKKEGNSARLRELVYRKDRLVQQKELGKAMAVAKQVKGQQQRLRIERQQARQLLAQKRLRRLSQTTGREMKGVQRSLEQNLQRLIRKKKQGAHIMRVRMRKLRQQATRKLTHHQTTQLSELRQSLDIAVGGVH